MANKIIKGRDLMLFDDKGKSFAWATNHTLTITADSAEITSKDHGIYGASEITKITWEITSENLYTDTDFATMFDKVITATPITIRFGIKAETDNTKTVADGDYSNWSCGTLYYEGSAVITNLQANANNGDNASYSVTFTGSGKLVKKGTASTVSTASTK